MLMERILGALTFKNTVYKEVEEDTSFASSAWLIVAVASFLNALGTNAVLLSVRGFFPWILGTLVDTLFKVAAFAVACFVIDIVGRTFFNAKTSFDELQRTLGLAYVWTAIGFLSIISVLGPVLSCAVGLFQFAAAIAGFAAWLYAAKEALDLEWPQVFGTVAIGWLILLLVGLVATAIRGLFGLTAGVVRGIFN